MTNDPLNYLDVIDPTGASMRAQADWPICTEEVWEREYQFRNGKWGFYYKELPYSSSCEQHSPDSNHGNKQTESH